MKKKIVMTTVLAALCLSFTACGAKETATTEAATETVIAETTVEAETDTETATEETTVEETTAEETTAENAVEGADIAAVAENVKKAVADKDIDALADLAAYPVYVGIGEGSVVETKEDFIALGADAVFTDALGKAIADVDVPTLAEVEAGIVMSGADAKPNITLGTAEDGIFGITGINY
ncbi:MAG: hypothetical protein PHE02_14355 [Lachnospiraceae bacterium]|nr:hypothetical protein [Lachnospiraceae bacterium]